MELGHLIYIEPDRFEVVEEMLADSLERIPTLPTKEQAKETALVAKAWLKCLYYLGLITEERLEVSGAYADSQVSAWKQKRPEGKLRPR